MTDIYEQHDAAFSQVQAFVILDAARERVATVGLKFPRDGAGRLWAYVHLIGLPMVRGHADGFGYDKRSAAVAAAVVKIPVPVDQEGRNPYWLAEMTANRDAFRQAASAMDSKGHEQAFRDAGFIVLQAI